MSANRRDVARPDLAAAQLYTAVVSDILDGLGYRDHTLDPSIRPLVGAADVVVAGWANPFLVAEAGEIPAELYTGEIAALDDVAPGEVVLVAAGGSARAACWGELFSTAARARGARGTVIDGYCRDHGRIVGMGLPGMVPRRIAAGLCQRHANFDPLAAMPRRGQYSRAAECAVRRC